MGVCRLLSTSVATFLVSLFVYCQCAGPQEGAQLATGQLQAANYHAHHHVTTHMHGLQYRQQHWRRRLHSQQQSHPGRKAAERQLADIPSSSHFRLQGVHPSTYSFLVPAAARQDGQLYRGSSARLRAKLRAWSQGKPLLIAAIGSSITAGQGVVDGLNCTWLARLESLLLGFNAQPGYGPVSLANGGVPGATSMFVSVCLRTFVPSTADVVIVEFASNDNWDEMRRDTEARRSFERMLRKLLKMPSRPAVLLLNSFPYRTALQQKLSYWGTPELGYMELAMYYHIPAVSIRACCYHLMRTGVRGFMVDEVRRERRLRNETDEREHELFFHDNIHPNGLTGHKAMAEIAWQLFDDTLRDALAEQQEAEEEELPPPMLPGNLESSYDNCLLSLKLQSAVLAADGFDWVNEAKENSVRPKFGYVGTQPGSKLTLKLRTQAAGGDATSGVLVDVAFLKSYEHMGRAIFRCDSGCACDDTVIEGHTIEKHSQTFMHSVRVSQAAECIVSVTISAETSSGEHKVKVIGLVVSEEAGGNVKQTAGVVGYTHDIATRGKDGLFDARNHAL